MHRFFADERCVRDGATLRLSREVLRHLRAARIRADEPFVMVVAGEAFEARLAAGAKDAVVLGSGVALAGTGPVRIELWLGLSKQDGLEQVLDGATELGAACIRLVQCERSVRAAISERQAERLCRIARTAAEVAGRAAAPRIVPPVALSDLPDLPAGGRGFVLWEEAAAVARPLGALLEEEPPQAAFLFIGPEGGLEVKEVEALEKRGFVRASLGPRILRARTAPLAALALVQGIWGDLGSRSRKLPCRKFLCYHADLPR